MADGAAQLLTTLRGQVADERVLEAIARVDRAAFVPSELRGQAYAKSAPRSLAFIVM